MSYLIQIPKAIQAQLDRCRALSSPRQAPARKTPGEANSAGLFCHLARTPLRTEERPPNSGVTMTDFRDLAKQARTVHEVRLAKDKSRHFAKSEAMASASDHLRSQALPLLETAQAQFKEEGVAAHIMAEPRHGTSLIEFQLVTPPRASDALQNRCQHLFRTAARLLSMWMVLVAPLASAHLGTFPRLSTKHC